MQNGWRSWSCTEAIRLTLEINPNVCSFYQMTDRWKPKKMSCRLHLHNFLLSVCHERFDHLFTANSLVIFYSYKHLLPDIVEGPDTPWEWITQSIKDASKR